METNDWIGLVALPAIGWALSQAWESWKNRKAKKAEAIDVALDKATEAIQKLTIALTEARAELKAELRVLFERTDAIPKIKDDLNALGSKVRDQAATLRGLK